MASVKTYVLAHTDKNDKNIAQARVGATSEIKAIEQFGQACPERKVTVTGIKGVE